MNMNKKREKDEHLERLWCMKEEKRDLIDVLKSSMAGDFNTEIIDELFSDGLVELTEVVAKLDEIKQKVALTRKGEDYARRIIRAHRLAERLIYDVLGNVCESGACEFEHTINSELVDSICTLLGHPRECPHGMPIPEGECCRRSAKIAESSVVPVTELAVGQSGRVAYVNCRNDQQLHKINGLQIKPGAIVKLHQEYPSYVIECEGASIALDSGIASNICVWKEPGLFRPDGEETIEPAGRNSRRWNRGFMFRRRRGGGNR
jgi:DtxR family Mn-dependent transcriptional regulator